MPSTTASKRLGVCSSCGRPITTADDLVIYYEEHGNDLVRDCKRVYMHETYEGCRKAINRKLHAWDERAWAQGWLS